MEKRVLKWVFLFLSLSGSATQLCPTGLSYERDCDPLVYPRRRPTNACPGLLPPVLATLSLVCLDCSLTTEVGASGSHTQFHSSYSSQLLPGTEDTEEVTGTPKDQRAHGHIRKCGLGSSSEVCTRQGKFLHLFLPLSAAQLPPSFHVPGANTQLSLSCSPQPWQALLGGAELGGAALCIECLMRLCPHGQIRPEIASQQWF